MRGSAWRRLLVHLLVLLGQRSLKHKITHRIVVPIRLRLGAEIGGEVESDNQNMHVLYFVKRRCESAAFGIRRAGARRSSRANRQTDCASLVNLGIGAGLVRWGSDAACVMLLRRDPTHAGRTEAHTVLAPVLEGFAPTPEIAETQTCSRPWRRAASRKYC